MKSLPTDARRMFSVLYVAAVVVLLLELAELAVLTYPPRVDVASWRYGALGVLASKVAIVALADAIILGVAIFLEHRLVLRVAGALHLLAAVVLLPLIVMYALDVLVLRRAIRPQFVRAFDLNSLRAIGILFLSSLAGFITFWRIGRAKIGGEATREARAVLITDQPGADR